MYCHCEERSDVAILLIVLALSDEIASPPSVVLRRRKDGLAMTES
jgi:hypothetical protein